MKRIFRALTNPLWKVESKHDSQPLPGRNLSTNEGRDIEGHFGRELPSSKEMTARCMVDYRALVIRMADSGMPTMKPTPAETPMKMPRFAARFLVELISQTYALGARSGF